MSKKKEDKVSLKESITRIFRITKLILAESIALCVIFAALAGMYKYFKISWVDTIINNRTFPYILTIVVFYLLCFVMMYIELYGYCSQFDTKFKTEYNQNTEEQMNQVIAIKYLSAQTEVIEKRFDIIKFFSISPLIILVLELIKNGINLTTILGGNYKLIIITAIIMYTIFIIFQMRYYKLIKTELVKAKHNFIMYGGNAETLQSYKDGFGEISSNNS